MYCLIRKIGESSSTTTAALPLPNGGRKYFDGTDSGGGRGVVELDIVDQAAVLDGGKTVVVLEKTGLYVVTGGAIVVTGVRYLSATKLPSIGSAL